MENNTTDRNSPAFSKPAFYTDYYGLDASQIGLTKRKYFATMAMKGIITNKDGLDIKIERIAESAVDMADALIEELNKKR